MDRNELTEIVVEELGRNLERDLVIRAVCEEGNMNWSQAEAFVLNVESDHRKRIAQKQSPLLIALSAAFLVGGLAVLIYCGLYYRDLAEQGINIDSDSLKSSYRMLILGFTAVATIIGGLIGLWRTLGAFE